MNIAFLAALAPTYWLVLAGVLVVVLVTVIILGYSRDWSWTGLPEQKYAKRNEEYVVARKTLWDWLQLLLVPLALAVGLFVLNEYQSSRDQARLAAEARRELDRDRENQQQQLMGDYLSSMSSLFLRGLGELDRSERLTDAARSVTFGVLPRLDPARKRQVFFFLRDAGLMRPVQVLTATRWWLEGADFSNADMTGVDLYQGVLTGLNFSGANFAGADLRDAFLSELDLSEADFSGALLRWAEVYESDFSGATFAGATFEAATIGRSTFQNANVRNALFEGAKCSECDFRDADIRGVNFRFARLRGNFSGAKAAGARFDDTRIWNSNFGGADLRSARFPSADLENLDFTNADVRGAEFELADLMGCDFTNANVEGVDFESSLRMRNVVGIQRPSEVG
jgi:uncharacterized protein YjbI with pentapeptide repeats